jgi:hypothetical protein
VAELVCNTWRIPWGRYWFPTPPKKDGSAPQCFETNENSSFFFEKEASYLQILLYRVNDIDMLKNKNPTNNSFSISKCCLKNNLKGQ